MRLEIGLPYRNYSEFTRLVDEIADPASTNYHHYLTPEQFIQRFAPNPADYQAVIDYLRAHHLAVTKTFPDSTLVVVTGAVADIESTFHLNLRTYAHPTENRNFFAPDTEPSLDLDVAVLNIAGLDNFVIPHPMNLVHKKTSQPANAQAHSGSGPGGNFMGNDFRAAYVPGVSLTGTGQAVGLLEFDGYFPGDITAYKSLAGLPNVTVNNVLLDGFDGSAGANNLEVALDIDMAISMAPGLSQVVVYEGESADTILTQMLNDNTCKQLSASWTYSIDSTTSNLFQRLGAQGQSFFNASGDSGAYTSSPASPTDDPYITVVGGTTLTTAGAGGAYSSEKVWNWFTTGEGTAASSGGISKFVSMPSWQQGISMTANKGSTMLRNLPDVALTADDIFIYYNNGAQTEVGGTSAACPLFAAFTALVNQQAAANGQASVGFINPAIYAIGKGPNYNLCFHDITSGNNTNSKTSTKFFAVTGYDLCTGWGTPIGSNMIAALAPGPPTIIQQPANVAVNAGSSATFRVTALGTGTLAYHWRLNGTNISGATAASYTINNAQIANQGNYSAQVSNSIGAVVSSSAALTINSPPVITSQPQGQNLTAGNNAAFSVTASGSGIGFQWQLNGINLANNVRISGAQSSSLAITGVLTSDAGNYRVVVTNSVSTTNSAIAPLTVAKATTTVNWSSPSPVVYGTALGASQLNASASQPGTYVYAPPAGSVPNAGTNVLSVVFTPNDTADYIGATNSVSLVVNPALLTVTASNATRVYGQANPTFAASIAGAVNGDAFTAGASCTATSTNLPGTYPIIPNISDPNNRLGNYTLSLVNGTLTITPAPAPVITDIEPDSGVTNGGTTVSIIGSNFQDGATVYFGSLPAASVTVSNATNVIVVTPAVSDVGPVDVVLTNADGQSVVFTNGFTYTGPQVTFSGPQITDGPTNQSVALGSDASFSVNATGSDILSYQWFFNSNNIAGATNAELTLTNVQPALAGLYSVIVTNASGAATSSVATLSIPGVPVSLAGGAQFANGQFTLQISGLTGQGPVVIQSSTDFVNWISIFTNAPGFGQVQFMDTNASNPATFYRAVTPSGQ